MHIFHKWRLVKIQPFSSMLYVGAKGYQCDICGKRKYRLRFNWKWEDSELQEKMMNWYNEGKYDA